MPFFKSVVSEPTLNLKHPSRWQCDLFICQSRSFHQELKYFLTEWYHDISSISLHSSLPKSLDFGAREDKGTTSETVPKMMDEGRFDQHGHYIY